MLGNEKLLTLSFRSLQEKQRQNTTRIYGFCGRGF
jgi:hypothetical protein